MMYARDEPDHNGWEYFETFEHPRGLWRWQACTHNGEPKGPEYGPFASEAEAYRHGHAGKDAGEMEIEE
jgi:hypothetical protein